MNCTVPPPVETGNEYGRPRGFSRAGGGHQLLPALRAYRFKLGA
ncbi:MAG: hypothetical protein R3272_10580 [Candidatus Promineifilaceae bacterium]|nr:hypothetical protein [Candidatus Promineifilaceae bacterium]